jgi:hypothetical protein
VDIFAAFAAVTCMTDSESGCVHWCRPTAWCKDTRFDELIWDDLHFSNSAEINHLMLIILMILVLLKRDIHVVLGHVGLRLSKL